MDIDGRQIPQREPTIPPDDPPNAEVPVNDYELNISANGGSENDGTFDKKNMAIPDKECAKFIKEYGLTTLLMWQMLHETPFGQDT